MKNMPVDLNTLADTLIERITERVCEKDRSRHRSYSAQGAPTIL